MYPFPPEVSCLLFFTSLFARNCCCIFSHYKILIHYIIIYFSCSFLSSSRILTFTPSVYCFLSFQYQLCLCVYLICLSIHLFTFAVHAEYTCRTVFELLLVDAQEWNMLTMMKVYTLGICQTLSKQITTLHSPQHVQSHNCFMISSVHVHGQSFHLLLISFSCTGN